MGLFDLFEKRESKQQEESEFQTYLAEHRELDALKRKYSTIENKHFSLLEKESTTYSQLCKTNNWMGKDAERLVKICLDDIALADRMRDCWLEEKKIQHTGGELPHYPAFETLVKTYEKQGRFSDAIQVCKKAIDLGFSDDGTKGGMQGRIERLEKKMKVTTNALTQK